MPLNSCIFAVHHSGGSALTWVERRIEGLLGYFSPLGDVRLSATTACRGHVVVGTIRFDGEARDLSQPLCWGSKLPARLRDAPVLVSAGPDRLRELSGPLAAIALTDARCVVIGAAGGMTALYLAESGPASVWSSHAVAAGWLARGAVAIDPSSISELIASDFIGGDRTLLRGVGAVPPATRIEISGPMATTASYWDPSERWAPIPAEDAPQAATERLFAGLERRLEAARAPVVGLTAGLDSRTVAVALKELGIAFRTFTWGEPGWGDVVAAAHAARSLGVPHESRPFRLVDGGHVAAAVQQQVRWNEGMAAVGPNEIVWPEDLSHWIPGLGAETGRAFYYQPFARAGAPPTPRALAHALTCHFESRLLAADAECRRAVRGRAKEWLAEARALGHHGWSALDVVYAEQRVRRWGRAMTPMIPGSFVPAFATAELLQALASLPLEDRLSGGMQHRLLERHAPALLPPSQPVAPPTRAPLLRAVGRLRLGAARRAVGVRRRRKSVATPWFSQPPWDRVPDYIEWIADEVLTSPLLAEAGGSRWPRELRDAFLSGDPALSPAASLASGPVALGTALRDLREAEPREEVAGIRASEG